MVSKSSDSALRFRKSSGEQASGEPLVTLLSKINHLKKQIQAERVVSIRDKLEKNGKQLQNHISRLVPATSRKDVLLIEGNGPGSMLSLRAENPLFKFSGFPQGSGDKDYANSQEVVSSTSTKLPYVEKIPPYTSWIFLDRNQRMAEDQSVVGRRRIYYDQHGSEALICSDSEEDIPEPEEEKHEFSESEDRILWMAFKEHGLSEEVLDLVSQYIGGSNSEIQDRCNILREKYQDKHDKSLKGSGESWSERSILLDKSLGAALDSFDNLFCRRCLVFDCRLHGCSQSPINPLNSSEFEEDGKPCSDQCYLRLRVVKDLPEGSVISSLQRIETTVSEEKDSIPASSNVEEPSGNDNTDILPDERCIAAKTLAVTSETVFSSEVAAGGLNSDASVMEMGHYESLGKRKVSKCTNTVLGDSTLVSDDIQGSSSKKQKKLSALDVVIVTSEGQPVLDNISNDKNKYLEIGIPNKKELQTTTNCALNESAEHMPNKVICPSHVSSDETEDNTGDEVDAVKETPGLKQSSKSSGVEGILSSCEWKPFEKELYLKGIEIYGRNSCLIARNLLSGLKTCIEVSSYMYDDGSAMLHRSAVVPSSFLEDNGRGDADYTEQEMPTRSRLFRRRGRTRKLKYSWKSAGHPSIWKRIADGKNQSCKQYTPCGCLSMCGKECPCQSNGTCCEKYCGCSKSCKNRFRGCHCAKSQCRSRQCPCFAAGRECDPDVCRNCWVSCGDGSLGEPPKRGDGQCGNMRLLLRQQQRILLAKSDVAGWGAFLKNSVNKNDYLGEYTGELISHREADKRGKIYDRANSSFLFDLNDQYVLDAYRKGDKLKFANHSSNPNCYAKVMLVAGDHRVGIFAKEHIEAGEELFYDYRYGPDQAPAWARKPEASKRDDSAVSQGRAKKHQSH
ncbi:histone-lysine N-methyltransferase EZA1 isoform X2 [Vitis riparia]|uniref:histone-lysine N-methyltransferase EZA1 isoform X2 n=1 Tax=Vitis riparia TaxID=96939 RepID=UPI00155A7543|nr:histone-lysine N-methyltransferase EZA1 isoform X2 [Vitis riparia]